MDGLKHISKDDSNFNKPTSTDRIVRDYWKHVNILRISAQTIEKTFIRFLFPHNVLD